jgi:hypothetical protein
MEQLTIWRRCLELGRDAQGRLARRINFKRMVFSIAVLLFVGVLAVLSGSSQQTTLRAPNEPVPGEFFGLHIHHLWQDTDWPDVPFSTWRLWDAHVTWALLEPQRNVYDFKLLDRYVEAAESHHVQLMLTFASTPAWASARPTEIPVHEGGGKGAAGSAAEPGSEEDWVNFIRTVATRYRGKIIYYEIWNEPMFKPYYSGTVPQMVALTRTARRILKEVDPQNQIVSPPVDTNAAGIQWLKEFLNEGGGDAVDIYGFHLYVPGPPEYMVKRVEQLRTILQEHQQSQKPMWNTEAGWQMNNRPTEMAANYVARSFLVAWPLGITRYYFYAWDNNTMGIMPRGGKGELAQAYRQAAKWMIGSTVEDLVGMPNNVWVEHLKLADGRQAKIAWSSGNPITLGREHVGAATSYQTLDGRIVPLQPGSDLPLTGSPVMLIYQ